MSDFAEQMERLRLAVAMRRAAPDLIAWAHDELLSRATRAERASLRDDRLRYAAHAFPRRFTRWQRAEALAREWREQGAARPADVRRRVRDHLLAEIVSEARSLGPEFPGGGPSARWIHRILTG